MVRFSLYFFLNKKAKNVLLTSTMFLCSRLSLQVHLKLVKMKKMPAWQAS